MSLQTEKLSHAGFALSKHGPSRFSFAKYIHALNQCQISVQSKAMTGQVQMFVQGSAAAQQTIIGFWSQILSPEDLANMNIQLNVEMRGQPACLTWTAAPKCPIPIHAMKHMLMNEHSAEHWICYRTGWDVGPESKSLPVLFGR